MEADPVATALEGSPDPWVPAVLKDAVSEQGFLGERDEDGHVARCVAEKQLRKDEPIESAQKACVRKQGCLPGHRGPGCSAPGLRLPTPAPAPEHQQATLSRSVFPPSLVFLFFCLLNFN